MKHKLQDSTKRRMKRELKKLTDLDWDEIIPGETEVWDANMTKKGIVVRKNVRGELGNNDSEGMFIEIHWEDGKISNTNYDNKSIYLVQGYK